MGLQNQQKLVIFNGESNGDEGYPNFWKHTHVKRACVDPCASRSKRLDCSNSISRHQWVCSIYSPVLQHFLYSSPSQPWFLKILTSHFHGPSTHPGDRGPRGSPLQPLLVIICGLKIGRIKLTLDAPSLLSLCHKLGMKSPIWHHPADISPSVPKDAMVCSTWWM